MAEGFDSKNQKVSELIIYEKVPKYSLYYHNVYIRFQPRNNYALQWDGKVISVGIDNFN